MDHLKSCCGVICLQHVGPRLCAFGGDASVCSATKAALHAYVLSQRFLLRDSGVRVLEVAPPWVRTELMNSQEAEQAMPLNQFVSETLDVLGTDADEILVEAAKPLRANPGPGEHALANGFNEQVLKLFPSSRSVSRATYCLSLAFSKRKVVR